MQINVKLNGWLPHEVGAGWAYNIVCLEIRREISRELTRGGGTYMMTPFYFLSQGEVARFKTLCTGAVHRVCSKGLPIKVRGNG